MKKKILIIAGVIILIIAYYFISPLFIVKEANEQLPTMTAVQNSSENELQSILDGQLIASAHDVSGIVAVYDNGDQKILRFEDLNTVNGPDLFIYLATDTTAEDFVNLGEIKATKGNVNYEISNDINLEKYDTVLVWCRAFKVLFSYAELK